MTKAQLIHLMEKCPDDTEIKIADGRQLNSFVTGESVKCIQIEENKVTTFEPPKNALSNTIMTIFIVT